MASTMGRSENARHVYMVSLYYVCFDGWPRWVWIQKKGKSVICLPYLILHPFYRPAAAFFPHQNSIQAYLKIDRY